MRIGVLTGGGDCPGLNAVIRAIVIQGEKAVMLDELAADIKVMEKKKQLLEDMLDRIVLRPLILRTRCELCPA